MESCICEKSSETLTELQSARLDRLAERINALPPERSETLLYEMEKEIMTEQMAFSLDEVSKILGCHKETVRRAIKSGNLKAGKIGKDYRVSKADLQAFYTERGGGVLFEDDKA